MTIQTHTDNGKGDLHCHDQEDWEKDEWYCISLSRVICPRLFLAAAAAT